MLTLRTRLLTLLLSFIFVVCSHSVFALVESFPPYSSLEELKPEPTHTLTMSHIMRGLTRAHYQKQAINDQLSERIFDIYLKDLDFNRSYFLASDIEEFQPFRFQLDNQLNRGKLDAAFIIYNRFQQRVNERLSYTLNELKTAAEHYTFETEERIELNREKASWPKSTEELDILWQQRLKNGLLNLMATGKSQKDSVQVLTKRYQNQLNRLHQVKAVDAYQSFMNAVTRSFDPHTQYFSPRSSENFNINMSLSLHGIGAVLQGEDEYTKVVRLIPSGPADKAGILQPSDKIIGVGQSADKIEDVIGWRLDEVVDKIRGPENSTVFLEILPSNSTTGSKVISIVREKVKLEEQSAQKHVIELKEEDGVTHKIGVIEIPTFYIDFQARMENRPDYTSTTRDVKRLIKELELEKIDGLIIDLRNNGGGSLDEAVDLTGLFVPGGPVVQVRGARGVDILQDRSNETSYQGPLVVLVNRLSASASEIFAGAIQDYGRGLVVGSQTFGKGTVQSLQPLPFGQLKITQAKFYRISGDSTQNKGVIPDIHLPSLINIEKIGESALDEAMPWDAINPAPHVRNNSWQTQLDSLKALHEARTKNNPDFIYLQKQRELFDQLQQQTSLSLNKKTREAEHTAQEKERLLLENKRRERKGQAPFKNADEMDKELEQLALKNKKEQKDINDDILLQESAQILLDFKELKPQKVAQGK